jgi:hypothetical protein
LPSWAAKALTPLFASPLKTTNSLWLGFWFWQKASLFAEILRLNYRNITGAKRKSLT